MRINYSSSKHICTFFSKHAHFQKYHVLIFKYVHVLKNVIIYTFKTSVILRRVGNHILSKLGTTPCSYCVVLTLNVLVWVIFWIFQARFGFTRLFKRKNPDFFLWGKMYIDINVYYVFVFIRKEKNWHYIYTCRLLTLLKKILYIPYY